jgi:inosine/xanthosine triphosphatase
MGNRVIAVGSIRRPKLDAVTDALKAIGSFMSPGAPFETIGVEMQSGVRHTPLSRREMMDGARHRAQALRRLARKRRVRWNYFVGLEGGVDVIREDKNRLVFLENWACVVDSEGKESFGASGSILLPESIAIRVVDAGEELAQVIDDFAGERGIRDAQGAWGVLTRNIITRRDAFRTAVISAFAPFLAVGPANPKSRS